MMLRMVMIITFGVSRTSIKCNETKCSTSCSVPRTTAIGLLVVVQLQTRLFRSPITLFVKTAAMQCNNQQAKASLCMCVSCPQPTASKLRTAHVLHLPKCKIGGLTDTGLSKSKVYFVCLAPLTGRFSAKLKVSKRSLHVSARFGCH